MNNPVGKLVIEKRKDKKISQRELAARVGCSSVFVCNIEKGNNSIPLDSVLVFCKVLGITPSEMAKAFLLQYKHILAEAGLK